MECLGSACFGVECFELTNQHVKFPVFPDSLKLASRAGRRESRDAVKTVLKSCKINRARHRVREDRKIAQ